MRYLGRGDHHPDCARRRAEAESISRYIHAEAHAAGERNIGPLAPIDADMPVIVVAPNNELLEKLKSNIEEVRAWRSVVRLRRSGCGFCEKDKYAHH